MQITTAHISSSNSKRWSVAHPRFDLPNQPRGMRDHLL